MFSCLNSYITKNYREFKLHLKIANSFILKQEIKRIKIEGTKAKIKVIGKAMTIVLLEIGHNFGFSFSVIITVALFQCDFSHKKGDSVFLFSMVV